MYQSNAGVTRAYFAMYSNRISNDVNVRITNEARSGRVLNLNKTCA